MPREEPGPRRAAASAVAVHPVVAGERRPVAALPIRRTLWSAFALASVLILFRSAVWVLWPQSHFDSDHAVFGLMAKHLAELRAFPLTFYGQSYLLGLEAWLAAPLFRLFGPSVMMLKLPLLAINLLVAFLLLRILVSDLGLSPAAAVMSSLFFLLPGVVASSRLLEVTGGSIETFAYVLLLWMLRARPIPFGLVGGFGFENREFTMYAVVAILALETLQRAYASRRAMRSRALSLAVMAGPVALLQWLKPHADLLGPHTAGPIARAVLDRSVAANVCWNGPHLAGDLRWLFTNNLATLFGWRAQDFDLYVSSSLGGGHIWALAAILGLLLVAAVLALGRHRQAAASEDETRPAAVLSGRFPAYLAIVGLLAATAYVLAACGPQRANYLRYTLLALFVPVGLSAWAYRHAGTSILRGATSACVLAWAVTGGIDDARVLAEYLRHAPVDKYQRLADGLRANEIKYARAAYGNAYLLDFLSNETLVVDAPEYRRIEDYRRIVEQHRDEAVEIDGEPCPPGTRFLLQNWCVSPPGR